MMAHAKLSPSAAHRWLNCTGSVDLINSLNLENTSSKYADEGTAAHALLSACLEFGFKPTEFEGMDSIVLATSEDEQERIKGIKINKDMVSHIEATLDYIHSVSKKTFGTHYYVETALPLFYSKKETGTADCIYYDASTKTLHVFDLKYGAGVFVSVDGNPQLIIYAISAIDFFKKVHQVEQVSMHIVQPRMDNTQSVIYSIKELNKERRAITAIAKRIESGGGEFVDGGEQCKFCPAKSVCPKLAADYFDTIPDDASKKTAPTEPKELIHRILKRKKDIEAWLNAIEKHALEKCEAGEWLDMFALEPKRPQKVWSDEDVVLCELKKFVDEKDLTKQVLLTPAQMLKLKSISDKKELKELVESFIISKVNGHNVVTIDNASEAFNDLNANK